MEWHGHERWTVFPYPQWLDDCRFCCGEEMEGKQDADLLDGCCSDPAPIQPGNGVAMLGAHTDSPALRMKPVSKKLGENGAYIQVGVETYGGNIYASFSYFLLFVFPVPSWNFFLFFFFFFLQQAWTG